MRLTRYIFIILLLLFGKISSIIGQNDVIKSSRATQIVVYDSVSYYVLDSLLILPSSIELDGKEFRDLKDVKFVNNGLVFENESFLNSAHLDTLKVTYRVLPINAQMSFNHLDEDLLEKKDKAIYIGYDYSPEPVSSKLIQETGIDYDGSFSRGFSLGNSQSLLLNSNFNMQMAGDLGEGIKIKAAISDDNIPIQPEGNTQLLQEFDKVFIQVSKDKSTLTAGDYELNRPKSYFVNYYKQVQGLSAYYDANRKDNLGLKSRTSFAVSRAKFNRIQLEVIEANQGPYKLPGNNGERFIIIEAGSEKIYEDGQLLTRGQNHDYVISYDRAEIIFTEKKLITKDSRIIAEYEYVDRSYLRTMYAADLEYSLKKWDFNFNYYSQQDSRNISGDGELDSLDIDILASSGDNLAEARRSGIRMIDGDFDNSIITYKLIEDSILVYSINPDSAMYVANFSEVSLGEGDYVIDTEVNANGRVYEYVGANMGNYIAEIQLIAPQKNQLMSLAATYHPSEKTNLKTELSLSNNDLNRFSIIDNEDNQGVAAYFKLDHEFSLGKKVKSSVIPFFSMERTQENFKALNPYRAVEFQRNWNLESNVPRADETFIISGFHLKTPKKIDLYYSYSSYNRGSFYDGKKHDLNYKIRLAGFEFTSTSSLLSSQNTTEKTEFLRPILGVSRLLGDSKKPWKIGYVYEAESNERKSISDDLFNANSAAFRVNRYFITSPKLKKFQTSLAYENRIDDGIRDEQFKTFAEADDVILSTKWQPSSSSILNADFTYRELAIADTDLAIDRNVEAKKSYLGQIDYSFNALRGFLRSTSSFNIGSGQQAKVEFDYQEVQPGEGNFDWLDINMDGIQQLGEFRQSEFQDTSRFIQVPLFNNEFIQTNNAGINQSLRLDGKSLFKPKKKKKDQKDDEKNTKKEAQLKKEQKKLEEKTQGQTKRELEKKLKNKKRSKFLKTTVGALSVVSTVRLNKKVEIDNQTYNPLDFSITDPRIVSFNSFANHTLFINRGNPKWDMQLGQRKNQNKIALISTIESRGLEEYFGRLRFGLSKKIDIILNVQDGGKFGTSEGTSAGSQVTDRNFDISMRSLKPELNLRPKNNFRLVLKYETIMKNQLIKNLETLASQDFTVETTWKIANKSSWNASLSYVDVEFVGPDLNSFVAFELLEGLKNGDNFLWRTSFTRRLANNVDFILNYEGRKTGENNPIHTARAQVKATF